MRALLAAVVLAWTAQAGRPQYSVGFDLSMDYAVASVMFANGTYVDAAKLQGGMAYRQTMRAAASSHFERHDDDPIQYRRAHPSQYAIVQDKVPAWLQPSAQALCDHLPSWVGKPRPDAAARGFSPMLQALKAAVEMYLGQVDSLQKIGVSVPFELTTRYQESLISAASSASLSMEASRRAAFLAGITASAAYGVEGQCDDHGNCDPEKLILAIDYSEAAFTAVLLHEDYGVFHTVRELHDEALGVAALDMACRLPLGGTDCTDGLRDTLRTLTNLPLPDSSPYRDIAIISQIVLHGESARDSRLDMALRDVLSDDVTFAHHNSGKAVNPLFAAARGMAEAGWLFIDQPPPDGCNCNDFKKRRIC